MRVAICHPQVPFTLGGAEAHVRRLDRALKEAGHEADIVSVPFTWHPPSQLVHQLVTWRTLDLTEFAGWRIDMVIALKFPAYLVRHPNKVVWLIHQHRTAYELWDHPLGSDLRLSMRHQGEDGLVARRMVHHADRLALGEASRLFTSSENVLRRLERSVALSGEVLHHRSALTETLLDRAPGSLGDYVLFPSRLERLKRQDLAIEAMRHVQSDLRLVLVGRGADADRLRAMIGDLRLSSRVDLLENVSDEALARLYLGALAVYYGPFDEDYGYVTLEGMAAGRLVIVPSDSGGPLELVRDEENGVVVEPRPDAIAEAFDRAFEDRALVADLGGTAREFIRAKIPTWPAVVRRLLD